MADRNYWQNLRNFTGEPIDYVNSPRRQPYGGMPGQFAGPAQGPMAGALSAWGVQQPPGIWQDLSRFAAPAINRGEQVLDAVPGMAGEMTGIPSAMRAGEQAAAGHYPQAAGNALMALPSRLGSILGMPLSQAEAQTPDPRQKRLDKLDSDIAKATAEIKRLGERTNKRDPKTGRWVPDLDRLKVLAKPQQDVLDNAMPEATSLRSALNAEFQAARDAELAAERGAERANTPTAQAYPGVQYGSAVGGGALSAMLAFRGARMPVQQFNQRVQSIVDRQKAAIDRANDKTLQAAERNQARKTAQAAQREYDAAIAAQPHLSLGDRARAFGTSGAATDFGMMLPALGDYIYSSTDPNAEELRSYSLGQLNPLENPGRFGVGLLAGGTAGVVGQEIGERFPGVRIPPSYGAETEGLPSRYQSPRKPSAPRKRK